METSKILQNFNDLINKTAVKWYVALRERTNLIVEAIRSYYIYIVWSYIVKANKTERAAAPKMLCFIGNLLFYCIIKVFLGFYFDWLVGCQKITLIGTSTSESHKVDVLCVKAFRFRSVINCLGYGLAVEVWLLRGGLVWLRWMVESLVLLLM